MKKSEVNGKNMNEVFAWLKSQRGEHVGGVAGTTAIKWYVPFFMNFRCIMLYQPELTSDHLYRNFTKFLIDKEGRCVGRYGSSTKPEKLKDEIEKLLA